MARKKPKGERSPQTPVHHSYWRESKNWHAGEQAVAMFLWTCPARDEGKEGLIQMNALGVLEGMAEGWTQRMVEKALTGLETRRWLMRDGDWMLLLFSLRDDQPWGSKQVAGAVRRLKVAPRDSDLWPVFMAAVQMWAPELFAELAKKAENRAQNTASKLYLDAVSDTASARRSTAAGAAVNTVSARVVNGGSVREAGTPQHTPDTTASLRVVTSRGSDLGQPLSVASPQSVEPPRSDAGPEEQGGRS